MKLNKSTVAALVLPQGKSDYTFFDRAIPGFGVRLRAEGSKNWVFQTRIGSKQRRMVIGKVSAMPVEKARERAEQLHALVKSGKDPFGEKVESQARRKLCRKRLRRCLLVPVLPAHRATNQIHPAYSARGNQAHLQGRES